MLDIKFNRLTELEAKLKTNTPEMKQAVQEIIKKNGSQMQGKMRQNMNGAYTAGYSNGATAQSVTESYSNAGMKVAVGPHTNYAAYLEYGTRFMSPRPTVRPAFLSQSAIFTSDMKKVMR